MARTAGKRAREEELSDNGFISNDEEAPKKKTKKAKPAAKAKATHEEEKFWELSSGRNPRRLAITDFNKTKLVNIREYYEKDDVFLPGKKGISLTIEQYGLLLKAIPKLNAELKAQGIDVSGEDNEDAEDDAMDEDEKPKKRAAAKKDTKANIEATSDEEEEEEEEE